MPCHSQSPISALLLRCRFVRLRLAALAHDIPNDVTVQAFLKPDGQPAASAGARAAEGHARRRFSRSAAPGYLDLARTGPAAARRGDPVDLRLHRALRRRHAPAEAARRRDPHVARIRPVLRVLRRGAGARHRPEAAAGHRRRSGTRRCSTCCSSTRFSRTGREFSIHPGLARLGLRVVTVLRFLPPGGAVRAFEFDGDPGLVRLDPRWYQAALRFVEAGILPHPGRHRPPAVSVLPGDPVPALPRADPDRDRVHRGALDHADRLGLQPGARTRCGFRR